MNERLPPAGLRVPQVLKDRADKLIDYVVAVAPEIPCVRRADVLRRALIVGLGVMEADAGRQKGAA